MMSSTWKISVFGIVALMLAFGLATTDALAAKGVATVSVISAPDLDEIRAGDSVDFTIRVEVTSASTDGDNVATTITIPIPTDWHRALHQPAELAAAGDVTKTETGSLEGEIKARALIVKVPKQVTADAANNIVEVTGIGNVEFVYRTPAPKIQKTYTWSVSAPRHTVTTTPAPFVITVGPVSDGSGTLALAATSGFLFEQKDDGDAATTLPHEGTWITYSEEALVLKVTYTPVGTMPQNSTVVLTVTGIAPQFTRLDDNTEVQVDGHVTRPVTRTQTGVTATVAAGGINHRNTIVFTIKKAKAPAVTTDAVATGNSISVTSAIDVDGAGDETVSGGETVGSPFNFVITKKPPVGTVTLGYGAVSAPGTGAATTYLVAGQNIGAADAAESDDKIWFVFDATSFNGIGGGSTYEIDIPDGWPQPFKPITGSAGDTQDGAVTGAFTDRTLTGSVTTATNTFEGAARSLQVNKAPTDQKTYTFPVRATAGPHTMMTAITGPTVEVTVGHGMGTLTVTRADGTPLIQTTGKAPLGNLLIIYKAAGRMLSGGQVVVTLPADSTQTPADLGWTGFREDNGDSEASPGEVTLSGKATLDVGTTTVTANINAEMAADDELRFLYKNVTVPDVVTATHSFTAMSASFTGVDPTGDIKHNIGIGRAPDGGGTLAISPLNADAAKPIDIMLTYMAEGKMLAGSQVKVTVPTDGNWPSPEGRTTVSTGTVSADATSMTVTTSTNLDVDDTVVFTYSNVEVPAAPGRYTFTAESKAHPTDGGLKGLSAGATIEVDEVAAGSVMLTNMAGDMVDSADPNEMLGDLTFTFTAEQDMTAGAQVSVEIKSGWSPPFRGNNAADSRKGAIWVEGATFSIDPGADQAGPWTIIATLDAALADGGTLTFTYMDVDAPSAEGTYGFATMASLASGGTLLEVKPSPSVIVREPVTALAVEADPTSVFIGEDISVTVTLRDADGEGAALGAMVIMLSDGDAGGTFDPESITIGDGGSDGTATYTKDTASAEGGTTLTATAADETLGLEAVTASVTVKSGITDKSADPDPISAGSDLKISATGEADAAATLKLSYVNADGNTVSVNKGLDPVGDPADGSQSYTRTITLPADIPEGDHSVTLTIASRSDTVTFEVINDQTPPMLSAPSASPVAGDTAADGGQVLLSVVVTPNDSGVDITSVTADVSELDSTQTDPVDLDAPTGESSTYIKIITISDDNTEGDGVKTVTFKATDRVENFSTKTDSITLRNDSEAPMLTLESAMSMSATSGTEITISVSSESGLTVTAEASSIGDGTEVELDEGMMDANGMNDMADAAPGNGVYTGTVTVGVVADDDYMISITGKDTSGNVSVAVIVSVTVDNTGPMLEASVDSDMAKDGDTVTIFVTSETGLTDVTANASVIGGDAAEALTESADTAGMYSSAPVTVASALDGPKVITISATDALRNPGTGDPVTVTVDNTAPTLSDAVITPDWALNGDPVTISVTSEIGLTDVTADASAIGGDVAESLTEGMDENMMGTGMYSVNVMVTGATGGDQTVSISASDVLGNASEPVVSTPVSIHVVTMADFDPKKVSTGDTVMVSAMGTAGLTATFDIFDAEGERILNDKGLTESEDTPGSYSYTFEVKLNTHPAGEYWVSVKIGEAEETAPGALTIDHKAQFDLAIGAGTRLIHVPLNVTHINGMPGTIDTVRDLYNALDDAVSYITTLDAEGDWNSYQGDDKPGSAYGDTVIGDDTGLLVRMASATTLELTGDALGSDGASVISLGAGLNLVGVPLETSLLDRISDAINHPIFGGITHVVVSNEAGDSFQTIAAADDPGDGPLMGGVGYIVLTSMALDLPVPGTAWQNDGGDESSAAPGVVSGTSTSVMLVQGKLIDAVGMMSREGLNVSVKNLSSGVVLGNTVAADEYSATFVKLDSSAAKVGDVLEIKADSPNPLLGIRPVQHVVTAEDVLDSRISLPDLVTYEIPAQTELLANYPNPFNPETWIPFRLAEDASVSLNIYGASGSLVRTIDIGFAPAAVYQARSEAIYWDGRNDFGEQVSSGIYFYHLNAGDFSATRKMVIVK